MGGGILSGLMWGTMTSVMVLGIASQMTPLPRSALEPVAAVVPAAPVHRGPERAQAPARPQSAVGPMFGVDAAPRVAAQGVAASAEAAAAQQTEQRPVTSEPTSGNVVSMPKPASELAGNVPQSASGQAAPTPVGTRLASSKSAASGPIEFHGTPEHPDRAQAEAVPQSGADALPSGGDAPTKATAAVSDVAASEPTTERVAVAVPEASRGGTAPETARPRPAPKQQATAEPERTTQSAAVSTVMAPAASDVATSPTETARATPSAPSALAGSAIADKTVSAAQPADSAPVPTVDGDAPEPIVLAAAAPSAPPSLLSQSRASVAQSLKSVTERVLPDETADAAPSVPKLTQTAAPKLAETAKAEITAEAGTKVEAVATETERPEPTEILSGTAAEAPSVGAPATALTVDAGAQTSEPSAPEAATTELARLDVSRDVPEAPVLAEPVADKAATLDATPAPLTQETDPAAEPIADSPKREEVQLAQARTEAPEASDAAPTGFGTRVVPLTERNKGDEGGLIRRASSDRELPRIGDSATDEENTTEAATDPAAEPDTATATTALERHAVPFDNPEGRPRVSVILIDGGEGGIPRRALLDMPIAVTFAVDPSRSDAEEAAKTYRQAGFEVLILAGGLPRTAQAADVETAFDLWNATIPEAVGILDTPDGRLAKNRRASEQMAKVLAASGHGLVLYDKGLNSAVGTAEAEGVPAGLAFRTLDERNENASTISRYLDRAAFRAAQEGHVIVVGSTQEPTVQAVLSWALEGKGTSMAVAPISAVLRGDD